MFIDVALVPNQARYWNDAICIFVDVLRASSTIVTLFDRGVSIILPVGSVRQARRLSIEILPQFGKPMEHVTLST